MPFASSGVTPSIGSSPSPGNARTRFKWMAIQFSGNNSAIHLVIVAPQSPPWAIYLLYPKLNINSFSNFATSSEFMPNSAGLSEKP